MINTKKKYNSIIFNNENSFLEYGFILLCFIFFVTWAVVQPFNSCPDEAMRYDVIKYVFEHNRLPHGGEESLINPIWGFSYAFLPYLSGLVSVVFMKFVYLFTQNDQILIIAARMASVFFGTITVYYIIKIANKLFNGIYKWLLIILVSCLPQFVFLSSYMNNDVLALMSVVMIIYYWIEGNENRWSMKSNVGLAISVSICVLSYYNAYPFILFSIVFFILSNVMKNEDKNVIIKKFITISIVVFILSGWWFIRNYVIYNGDFLGMKTMTQYSNMYAYEDIKPINHITPQRQNISIIGMLINQKWLSITYKSFLGVFGWMNIDMMPFMYTFFTVVILVGLVCFILKLLNNKKVLKGNNIILLFMVLASILTVCLSIYRSYTVDFQPQGRYVIECLIPIMIIVTCGFEYFSSFLRKKFNISFERFIALICFFDMFIVITCLLKIIIPAYLK